MSTYRVPGLMRGEGAVCVCCGAGGGQELRPEQARQLTSLYMIKVIQDDTDLNKFHMCQKCVTSLAEADEFKKQVFDAIASLRNGGHIKARKAKGGYLIVKKPQPKIRNAENNDRNYLIEFLDESLLGLDDLDIDTKKIYDEGEIMSIAEDLDHKDAHEGKLVEELYNFNDVMNSDLNENRIKFQQPLNGIEKQKLYVTNASEVTTFHDDKDLCFKIIESVIKEHVQINTLGDLQIEPGKEATLPLSFNLAKREKVLLPPIQKRVATKEVMQKCALYEVNEDLKCDHCAKVMPNVKMYHAHMNLHFPNHVCETCGKKFSNIVKLNRHKSSHEKGPFKCNFCAKIFSNYNTMNSHRRRKHSEVKIYKCPKCDERFMTFHRRLLHLADVHGHTKRKYKCGLCDLEFLVSGNLSAHIRRKHLKIKNHHCPECRMGFFRKQDLLNHMPVHNGLRLHECVVCYKRFLRSKTLTVHMQTHSDYRRYECGICSKKFIQKITLMKHLIVHQKEEEGVFM